MANINILKDMRQFTSAGDLSGAQYLFVKRDAGNTVVVSGAGEAAVGVLLYPAEAADRAVSVVTTGEPDVYAGEALTAGDEIAADANGKAVVAVSGDVILGYAREDASAADVLVQIDFLGEAQTIKA
jgi:hypothetical protein